MILYTMMPHELVYPCDENEFGQQMMVNYQGIPLLVQKTEGESYQVMRVLSTDPQHFLNESCMPGSKISIS